MNQQIVVIGGGTTFDSYKSYISYLKNKELTLDMLRPSRDWKDTLAGELGKNFDVLLPKMPNKTNAQYREWKIWFERVIPLLNKEIVLIGHSLGGTFLVKYLSENIIPKTIIATILVAAPFDDEGKGESLASFALPSLFAKFAKQCQRIYLIQSKDDPVVPFEHIKKYCRALPNAETMIFENRGHFNQETFPEAIELIRKL